MARSVRRRALSCVVRNFSSSSGHLTSLALPKSRDRPSRLVLVGVGRVLPGMPETTLFGHCQ